MKHYIIEATKFRLDGGAMFGIIPKPLWKKGSPADSQNRIDLALRILLIIAGNKKILIDTGIGDYHNEKFNKNFDIRGPILPINRALKDINLTPDDITDIIISHLHFDHVGGLTYQTGENDTHQLLFKNANIHLHKKHYDYSLSPNIRDMGSFHSDIYRPIIEELDNQNRINWLDGEAGRILEIGNHEIRFIASHGHTPFMIHPLTDNYLYLADIIPTANHIKIPWIMGYDMNPAFSTDNKQNILKFLEATGKTAIFEHDPIYYGTKIKKDSRGNFMASNLLTGNGKHLYSIP